MLDVCDDRVQVQCTSIILVHAVYEYVLYSVQCLLYALYCTINSIV